MGIVKRRPRLRVFNPESAVLAQIHYLSRFFNTHEAN